jgi:hypothetical protein
MADIDQQVTQQLTRDVSMSKMVKLAAEGRLAEPMCWCGEKLNT